MEVDTCQLQCTMQSSSSIVMGPDLADEIQLTLLNKCTVSKCTRSHFIISRDYLLQDNVSESRTQSTYLGIISNILSWSINTTSGASKILNFLRRNVHKKLKHLFIFH